MRYFLAILLAISCLLLSGCGFHFRSSQSAPTALNPVFFSAAKPYSTLTTDMRQLLDAMKIRRVKEITQAPFSLIISVDNFVYSRPDIANTTLTSNMNFMQSATLNIIDNRTHALIASRSFSTTASLTLNVNQIYTADRTELIKQELNREITLLIYYWLTSSQTKAALQHATFSKPT